jgi:hypothetical protein
VTREPDVPVGPCDEIITGNVFLGAGHTQESHRVDCRQNEDDGRSMTTILDGDTDALLDAVVYHVDDWVLVNV